MSQDTNFLELKNCIDWKLWYTAHVLNRIKGRPYFSDDNGALDLCRSIGCSLDELLAIYKLLAAFTDNKHHIDRLHLLQFEKILDLIEKNVPEVIKQELLNLHEAIKSSIDTENCKSAQISDLTLQFLEKNLWIKPSLVHWTISQLLCIWSASFIDSDSVLQSIYITTIHKILTAVNFPLEKSCTPTNCNVINNLNILLCLLSKVELTESKEQEIFTWLCPTLLQTCSFDDIEVALYSRKDLKYFTTWHEFLDSTYARNQAPDTLETSLKVATAIFHTDAHEKVSLNARELLLRLFRRRVHWLSDILTMCHTVLINNRMTDVANVLQSPTLSNLRVAVLLQFLKHCPNVQITSSTESWTKSSSISATIRRLLQQSQDHWHNPVMARINSTILSHLNILDWIIECKKTDCDGETVLGAMHQGCSIPQILHHLQMSSGLSVIKTFVPNVHEKPFDEIHALLSDSEESQTVYKAYYCMLVALKALLRCHNYNTEFEAVTEDYSDMEKHVNTLNPLNLRLEVMENIFSMMLLRHEDFSEADNISEGDEEDEDDEKFSSSQRKSSSCLSGFVCNKYAIRETLHHLQRCVFVARNECKLKSDLDHLDHRIQCLQGYLTEATWRLELLVNSEFIKRQGLPDICAKNSVNVAEKAVNLLATKHRQDSGFYRMNDSSSDEIDLRSDIDVSSESSSVSNQNGKRRKRRKNSVHDEFSQARDAKRTKEFTLNYMLASKETLVLKCLWKDDYDEAQRVIDMFNMQNSHLAGEIAFSRAMHSFRQDIMKQLTLKSPQIEPKAETKHSTLEFIRKAAREGIQASRTTSQVETFLAAQESNILRCSHANSAEIMTLITLDLALTMGQDRGTSENLAEVAMKYLNSCKKLENTRFHEFYSIIYRTFNEMRNVSLVGILCDARIPLSLKEQQERNDYWLNLRQKLTPFENKTEIIDRIGVDTDAELVRNQLQNISSNCGHEEPYLKRLLAHLELLQSLAPMDVEKFNMKPSLMKNSLHSYIGYQIFELNVDLAELELTSNQLQVNLVYAILVNCCPKLLCDDQNRAKSVGDKWGMIVLNAGEFCDETSVDSNDPNQCVIDMLSELVQALADENLSAAREVLTKSKRLACLDLSHLSFGNQTLAFFLNVFNLMILHAMLEVWSADPPQNDLRHAIAFTTLGYELGDLGLVTLYSLRRKLLGQSLCNFTSFGFEHLEELNEPAWQDLDLPQDPRCIFAMVNEFQNSPIVNAYHAETLNDTLNTALTNYLSSCIGMQTGDTIRLPQLVKQYENLRDSLDQSKISVNTFLGSGKQVEYDAFEYIYSPRLSYTTEHAILSFSAPRRRNSDDGLTWKSQTITPKLLHYLEGHCWLLSYLLQRIYENPTIINDSNRTEVLENLLISPWVQQLKCLFQNNSTVAGLWKYPSMRILWAHLEACLSIGNYKQCLDIVDALPSSLTATNVELQSFRDKILTLLIADSSLNPETILQYLYCIRNIHVLVQVVQSRVKEWPVKVCEDAVNHVLSHVKASNLPAHCTSSLQEILCRVMVFDKMQPFCESLDDDNWHSVVYRTEKTDPIRIVKSLIDANQYELCLKWLEYQTASSEIQSLVSHDLVLGLLKNEKNNFQHARKLLSALPRALSIKLCKKVIDRVDSIAALRFAVGYLLEHSSAEQDKYQRGFVGVGILELLDARDRPFYIHLITEPLLLLEQLLMNCKFDALQKILKSQAESLKQGGISIEAFDEVVRFYANKSLDFRVAIQADSGDNKSRETLLNQSGDFVMPVTAPTRVEWVPDDKAKECSCCRAVIFSMFNRRHHCRRCGRVVCSACSAQRMKVPGYAKSVLVRVCNDCKRQSTLQIQGAASTPSSETFDAWRLTTEETHNQVLRDEFCFEYAPNVSLCLVILNLHSDHKAYVSFLLDCCDEMKKLFYPDDRGQINPEVDHSLIIKMIRSLLIAAKVKCAKLGLNTGLTACDRFLSQVDLIATLVQSDCLSLIPRDVLNDHTLRRLRDLLAEKEQWTLALDVSTKSGLETQGVWAAWGKACLKVGYYEKAREKFAYCLDKVHQDDFDDWVMLSHPGDVQRNVDHGKIEVKPRETLTNRPSKDPPLLMEILQILDVSNSPDESSVYPAQSTKTPTAQEILNRLNSLKALSNGQYTSCKFNSGTRNVRYQEGLYYLLMYGSFNSILEFFVRYEQLDKCLAYVLENDIEPEIFFNVVFLGCMKSGSAENLFAAMRDKDSSLLTWRNYLICTCSNLEKKQLYNSLYQVQLFMRDYVRAAMACIRFYVTDASSYADLCSRSHWLVDAQRHLETELQSGTFGRSRRKSVSSSASGHTSLTMEMEPSEIDKHINTISRQMEVAKFLAACEKEGRSVSEFLSKLSFMDSEGLQPRTVPTLFGNQQERTYLSVLAILCGRDVEEGFGVAFRVIQDYNLRPQKVYLLVGHILALDRKINSIEQLIKCCRSSGAPNSTAISDRVLAHCVKFLLDRSRTEVNPGPKDQIDTLIKIITDVELKIASYIESKQLKAAYLLAVKHARAQDIRKILKEADRLGQTAIKSICTKWLQQTQQ